MSKRSSRAQMAQETLAILAQGSYLLPAGQRTATLRNRMKYPGQELNPERLVRTEA
jgi:hypothetical protein